MHTCTHVETLNKCFVVFSEFCEFSVAHSLADKIINVN